MNDDDVESAQYVSATPKSTHTQSAFRLQAPPIKVHQATPRAPDGFEEVASSSSPPMQPKSPPPQERVQEHVSAAPGEQTYDAVPIPGAYASTVPQQGHGQPF